MNQNEIIETANEGKKNIPSTADNAEETVNAIRCIEIVPHIEDSVNENVADSADCDISEYLPPNIFDELNRFATLSRDEVEDKYFFTFRAIVAAKGGYLLIKDNIPTTTAKEYGKNIIAVLKDIGVDNKQYFPEHKLNGGVDSGKFIWCFNINIVIGILSKFKTDYNLVKFNRNSDGSLSVVEENSIPSKDEVQIEVDSVTLPPTVDEVQPTSGTSTVDSTVDEVPTAYRNEDIDTAYLQLTLTDIREGANHVEELPIGDRRGLTLETLKYFDCGFIKNWRHPKNIAQKKPCYPTPRIIVPTASHYEASTILSKRNDSNKKTQHAGQLEVFNIDAINTNQPIIVVEGAIDALSIWQATEGKANVISVCGANNYRTTLLKNLNFTKTVENPLDYSFVIMFDNDNAGRDAAPKLRDELIKMNFPAVIKFLDESTDIKVDANQILMEQGDAALKAKIDDILHSAQVELDALRSEMKQKPKIAEPTPKTESANCDPNKKRITAELKDRINRCDIKQIAERYMTRATKSGYICPECKNGSGTDGTGANVYNNRNDGYQHIGCRKCGNFDKDVFDLIAYYENLDAKGAGFYTALERACEVYGIPYPSELKNYTPTPSYSAYEEKDIPAEYKISADLRKQLFTGDITDIAGAKRLFVLNEDKIRFMTDREKWAYYDGTVWKIGGASNSFVLPYVHKAGEILRRNAKTEHEKKISAGFSSMKKIEYAIKGLKCFNELLITQEDLNQHPHLLNCLNGVVDLETGKLYQHDHKLYLTQKCNAEYHAGVYSTDVDNFLKSILPDEETLAALIRFLGYSLTGKCNEEKALFLRGPGGNGKGTLTSTLLKLFGDYGVAFPIRSLLMTFNSNDAESATPALAKLVDCRLAICEEIPQNKKLDAAKFKQLTGGDAIYYRRLHEEGKVIEQPTHKFIVSGNYDIELSDAGDLGIKRRWLQIPFTQSFIGNCNPHLKDRLIAPAALNGLLSRLVDAAITWYKDGLIESSIMVQARKNYFADQDFVAEFLDNNVVLDEGDFLKLKDLIQRLKEITGTNYSDRALKAMLERTLTEKYGDRVYTKRRDNRVCYFGVSWRQNSSDR